MYFRTYMKSFFRNSISLLMAFVVLFSTMSFTVNSHYCGHILVDKALFKEAKSCGMEMQKETTQEGCSVDKPDCCNDEHLVVQGQHELQLEKADLKVPQLEFLIAFTYTYLELLLPQEVDSPTFIGYSPPPLVKSIFKLDETYLI